MKEKLLKTSVQLPAALLREMTPWPGLTQSEALRLAIERGHYLACLKSDETAAVAEHYMPILMRALEDLDYGDYKLATRSLPDIVAGFLRESDRSWRGDGGESVRTDELVDKLRKMNAQERIGVLDCAVAERFRNTEPPKVSSLPNADDFQEEIRELWRQSESNGVTHVDVKAGDVHRKLGGYPSPNNRMANCCQVMRRLMQGRDKVIASPPKGAGPSLVVRYFLPRESSRSGETR